jgi:hypothetical protein
MTIEEYEKQAAAQEQGMSEMPAEATGNQRQ